MHRAALQAGISWPQMPIALTLGSPNALGFDRDSLGKARFVLVSNVCMEYFQLGLWPSRPPVDSSGHGDKFL